MKTYPEEIHILFVSYAQIPLKIEIYADSTEIDWGDGNRSGSQNFSVMHEFKTEGTYHIRISGKKITGLNISRSNLISLQLRCPALEYLDCSVNELNELDLSHCPALEELYCNSNNLTQIDLSGLQHLQQANLSYNLLKTLDITLCRKLNALHCYANHLSTFKFKPIPFLNFLDLGNNLLNQDQVNDILNQLSSFLPNGCINCIQDPASDEQTL